jgi:hypothetical protein
MRPQMTLPKPKIPLKIWAMLGVVGLFALLLSYFLVIGVYDITTPQPGSIPR